MKTTSTPSLLYFVILLILSSCLYDSSLSPQPEVLVLADKNSELDGSIGQLDVKENKIYLHLIYEKNKLIKEEKIEVNRNQATINFDNNYPRIYMIKASGKFTNLKNLRLSNNSLREIPDFAVYQGIKRIDLSHNQIYKLPVFKKNTTLLSLDLSYNFIKEIPDLNVNQGLKRLDLSHNQISKLPVFKKNTVLLWFDISHNKINFEKGDLKRMNLPKGATLNIEKTGIPCKLVCEYVNHNPEVIVISDCGCKVVSPKPISK